MSSLQQLIARKIAAHVGDEKFYGLYMETAGDILSTVLDRASLAANNWLTDWSHDLYDTRDEYINAQTTGKMNGRNIPKETAIAYAAEFRERAEAVRDCAPYVSRTILDLKGM